MDEIRLEGIVDGWGGDGTINAQSVRTLLAEHPGDLLIWLNSPGGDVIEGSLVYTAIKEHKGNVRICVEGIAASAASVIAMAADELCMSPTSYLMIHRASTVAWGNVDSMDEASRQLRAVDEGIIDAYELKTGMDRKAILKLMQEESWINASAAVEMGFADLMLYQDEQPEDSGLPAASGISARLHAVAAQQRQVIYACGGAHPWDERMPTPDADPQDGIEPDATPEDPDIPDPKEDKPKDPGEETAREKARLQLMACLYAQMID